MFFTLSKIAGFIIAPLNLVFLVIVTGLILRLFSKQLGKSVIMLGIIMVILFGLFPLGKNALAYLENIYERPMQMPDDIDGILVLGGAAVTGISDKRNTLALNDSAERLIEALILGQKYPEAIIVFSGGNGHLIPKHDLTEADVTRMLVEDLGYPSENIFYEDQSRTTFENIRLTRELILPQPEETWVLITSAYHMPRAMAVAQRQNWINFIPYPVDYRTAGKIKWLPSRFDLLGNFYDLHIALHEYAGLAGYQIAGKISLPWH